MKQVVKNVTPQAMRCQHPLLFCPSIHEEGSRHLIVGKRVAEADIPTELRGSIGPDEVLIEVPVGLVKPGDSV